MAGPVAEGVFSVKGVLVEDGESRMHPQTGEEGPAGIPLPHFFVESERDSCRGSSGGKVVAMMQTAKPWHGYDLAACTKILFSRTNERRSFRQSKMSSVHVVILDVLIHKSFQMPFIEDDHVVEQIAAAIANPTL